MVLARVADFFTSPGSAKAQSIDNGREGRSLDIGQANAGNMTANAAEADEDDYEAVRPPYIHVGDSLSRHFKRRQ